MKNLFFTTRVLYRNDLNVMLDEAELAHSRGETSVFIICDGCIGQCCLNITGSKAYCLFCKRVALAGIQSLSFKPEIKFLGSYMDEKDDLPSNDNEFNSIESLKSVEFAGCDVGYGVASHVIELTRDSNPVFNGEMLEYVRLCLLSSRRLTRATQKFLLEIQPERVVLFNWRFYDARPVYRMCKKTGIDIDCFDFVYSRKKECWDKFCIRNGHIHDVDIIGSLIEDKWAESAAVDPDTTIKTGEMFFQNRFNRSDKVEKLYTGNQIMGRLPDCWNENNRNVVIFNSSEDEIGSIDRKYDDYRYCPSQFEVYKKILGLAEENNLDIKYYLRIHPNLSGVVGAHHLDLYKLEDEFSNVTVIAPESPISSYDLIKNAEKVIVCGSTVGIESVYWGTPCILLGPALYRNLNCCYMPVSDDELIKLLSSNLPAMDKTAAVKYGYYMMCERGSPFEYFPFQEKSAKLFGFNLPFHNGTCKLFGSSILFSLAAMVFAGLFFHRYWYKRNHILKSITARCS